MDYLKVVILLWTYNIAVSDASPIVVEHGYIKPRKTQLSHCGELLEKIIDVICVESKLIRHPRGVLEILAPTIEYTRDGHQFLRNKCCARHCSLNFIKANCPGKRRRAHKKNNANTSQPTKASNTTIISPKQQLELIERSGKQNITNVQPPFTRPTTTTTASRPITTTTIRLPTTKTTTTHRPFIASAFYDEYYYVQ